MPGGGSGSGGLWMRGHDTGTLYGWYGRESGIWPGQQYGLLVLWENIWSSCLDEICLLSKVLLNAEKE